MKKRRQWRPASVAAAVGLILVGFLTIDFISYVLFAPTVPPHPLVENLPTARALAEVDGLVLPVSIAQHDAHESSAGGVAAPASPPALPPPPPPPPAAAMANKVREGVFRRIKPPGKYPQTNPYFRGEGTSR